MTITLRDGLGRPLTQAELDGNFIDLDGRTVNLETLSDNFITLSDYGVVGDGITDDSAAVKAAHDAAVEMGFSLVYCDNGVYSIPQCRDTTGQYFGIDDVIWVTNKQAFFVNGPRTRIHKINRANLSVLGNIDPERHLRNFNNTRTPTGMVTGDSLGTTEGDSVNTSETFYGMLQRAVESQNLALRSPNGNINWVNAAHGGGTFTQLNGVPSNKPVYVSDDDWALNQGIKPQLEWIRTYTVLDTETIVAAASQTVFNTAYDFIEAPVAGDSNRSEIAVYVDGVWQSPTTFTESAGNTVTFTTPFTGGESVKIDRVTPPDVLFIYYGMNDADGFVAAQFQAALAKIELWSQNGGTNNSSPMNKEPDIIFVTNLVPSRMTDNANISDNDPQEGRDAVAHFTRTFANRNDFGFIDMNRKYNMVREGYDVTSQYLTISESNVSANFPLTLADTRDYYIKMQLDIADFTETMKVIIGQTLNTDCFVNLSVSGVDVTVDLRTNFGSYASETLLGAAPASGDIKIEFAVMNGQVTIEFFDASDELLGMYSDKVIRTGGIYTPTISFDTITPAVFYNYWNGEYTPYTPTIVDNYIWDSGGGQGGNDSNHPNSQGAQLVYWSVLKNTNFKQTVINVVNDAGELKKGIGTANPQGFDHVTRGGEVYNADGSRLTPTADANARVTESTSNTGHSYLVSDGVAVRDKVETPSGDVKVLLTNATDNSETLFLGGQQVSKISPEVNEYQRVALLKSGVVSGSVSGAIAWDLSDPDNRDAAEFTLNGAATITFSNTTAAVERVITLYCSNAGNALTLVAPSPIKWANGTDVSTYTGTEEIVVTITFINNVARGTWAEFS